MDVKKKKNEMEAGRYSKGRRKKRDESIARLWEDKDWEAISDM